MPGRRVVASYFAAVAVLLVLAGCYGGAEYGDLQADYAESQYRQQQADQGPTDAQRTMEAEYREGRDDYYDAMREEAEWATEQAREENATRGAYDDAMATVYAEDRLREIIREEVGR